MIRIFPAINTTLSDFSQQQGFDIHVVQDGQGEWTAISPSMGYCDYLASPVGPGILTRWEPCRSTVQPSRSAALRDFCVQFHILRGKEELRLQRTCFWGLLDYTVPLPITRGLRVVVETEESSESHD